MAYEYELFKGIFHNSGYFPSVHVKLFWRSDTLLIWFPWKLLGIFFFKCRNNIWLRL